MAAAPPTRTPDAPTTPAPPAAPATAPVAGPATTPPGPAAASGPRGVPYRLTADDYFRMVDADIIPRDRRVELWEGRLVETMAKKQAHAVAQMVLVEAI